MNNICLQKVTTTGEQKYSFRTVNQKINFKRVLHFSSMEYPIQYGWRDLCGGGGGGGGGGSVKKYYSFEHILLLSNFLAMEMGIILVLTFWNVQRFGFCICCLMFWYLPKSSGELADRISLGVLRGSGLYIYIYSVYKCTKGVHLFNSQSKGPVLSQYYCNCKLSIGHYRGAMSPKH